MPSPLSLTCSLGTPSVPVTGQPRLVYLLVEVSGGAEAPPLPVNLGLVIDVSDSMRIRMATKDQFARLVQQGQVQEIMTDGVPAYRLSKSPEYATFYLPRRIDYVAKALATVGEFLRPGDRFSLTAFATHAQTIIPSTPGSNRGVLKKAALQLENLSLGDETHLADGLALAMQEIRTQESCAFASRLVLLTDGHTSNVRECYEWADRARQRGIGLTTMGIGSEFNEELLIPLADQTGGNAYYIESPEQMVDVFRQELGSALRVSCSHVQLWLQLSSGVVLKRAHRVLPRLGGMEFTSAGDRQLLGTLGDFEAGVPQSLLLEIIIPGWSAGSYRLGRIRLDCGASQAPGTQHQPSQDVVLRVTPDYKAAPDERVLIAARKVGVFRAGIQALDQARLAEEQGIDLRGSVTRFRQLASSLQEVGEKALAEAIFQQADTLEKRGQVDPAITKRLRYETRRLTQSLSH
jgi:Ca-activated chloride channel family protein